MSQSDDAFSQVVIERDVEVPMRDGVILRADVYRPADGHWPVLLKRTPYDKNLPFGTLVDLDPMTAVLEGFAVVIQDVRGRASSDGRHQPFDERDDGYDTVEWCAVQQWCDGNVGMYGSSYHGATQMAAASTRPPHLRAISPIQASSDYYEGRSYFGGAFELGALLTISLGTTAYGSFRFADLDKAELRRLRGEIGEVLAALPQVVLELPLSERFGRPEGALSVLTPWFMDWVEKTSPDDPYWESISLERRHHDMDVPSLHVSSWFDQFHVGTLRNYEGIRAGAATDRARGDQYLIVGPWNHYPPRTGGQGSIRVGDVDFGRAAKLNMDGVQLGWFRQRLKGEAGAFRQRKRVKLFVMGRNVWRDEDEWPLARAVETPLYLGATGDSGELLWDQVDQHHATSYEYDPMNPVPTHGGAHLVLDSAVIQGPVVQNAIEERDDVLTFTTDPVSADVEVTGWVNADLRVSSSAVSTDFTVRLCDVHPDGKSVSVCDGIRRVRCEAGDAFNVQVGLGATSHVFLKGHRLRIQVSSSNSPRFDVNPNTGARAWDTDETVTAHQQVHFGGPDGSRIVLPIIPY
ncbi:CocE/NonD family hydrolase [Williamsia sp. D3]|uniref:CocE/NonD family hydrolase n=1 Tax=Williamsia sp. D3 TaxID=1313067 RepID=UPI000687BAE9|nr:CocE/NonD family hydrolase [Williamsia sp. D3]